MQEFVHNILIVDDDEAIRALLREAFEQAGFAVYEAANSAQARTIMESAKISLVTVDVLLDQPNDTREDGKVLAREIRAQYDCAIIMLSVLGKKPQHYGWLEHWADASIPKPFEAQEVVAQARAILRRYGNGNSTRPVEGDEQEIASFMGWELNTKRHDLIAPDGKPVGLTMGEFTLLLNFLRKSGEVLTREWIFNQDNDAQDGDADNEVIDRAIDMRISRLRAKLRKGHPSGRDLIETVRAAGYRLKPIVRWDSRPIDRVTPRAALGQGMGEDMPGQLTAAGAKHDK